MVKNVTVSQLRFGIYAANYRPKNRKTWTKRIRPILADPTPTTCEVCGDIINGSPHIVCARCRSIFCVKCANKQTHCPCCHYSGH